MMRMTAATTSTVLGDAQLEFPTFQLEDELVFKGGRDIMGLIWCWLAHDKATFEHFVQQEASWLICSFR
jgi:hypothetical protein